MKPKSQFIRNSQLALVAMTFSMATAIAGTVWDGGGANTNINTAANWNDDIVNAIDGTTAASFATAGNTATMNVAARFTTLTFNRDDAAGFTIAGSSILAVNNTGTGSTINLLISDTPGNGATTIMAPFQVNTANNSTRLLNINNLEKDIPAGSLVFNGNLNASTAANPFAIRAGGTGVTVFNGTLSNVNAIQQVNSGTSSGRVIINGNQALGTATVNIPTSTSGTVSSAFTIQMGSSISHVQSWASTTINQPATVIVNSAATLTGSVGVGTGASLSGATMIVDGALTSATTLGLGGATTTATLKIGGSASFAGAVTIGAAPGSSIVGNSVTNGTLSLSSGTLSANVTVGGPNTNDNNLNLTKINGGTLNIAGSHTYSGNTTINAGVLNLEGSITSPATVNAGGSLNINGSTTAPVTVNASGTIGGTGTISNTLTFATGSSTLNYALTGPLTANSVDVSAASSILVAPASTPANGTPYVALKRSSGTFSQAEFGKFALATRAGTLSLTGGNTEITITPATAAATSLVWKGNINNAWEASTVQNWTNSGSPDRYYSDDSVTFDDSATSFTVSITGASVTPGNIVFNNSSPNDYSLGGGNITGPGSLTKRGSGNLTLTQSGTNTFTGDLNLEAGTLSISNLNQIGGGASTRPITLKGGTLAYSGVTTTTDALPLVLASNSSTIHVPTAAITLRFGSATTGSGNLIKSGAGILALGKNGNNATGSTPDPRTTGSTFSGTVTVNAGALEVRNPDSLGASGAGQGTTVNSATLDLFPFGQNQGIIVDPEPLTLTGNSFFRSITQDQDTAITNEWTGPVTVAANASVGISSPRINANFLSKLIISGPITTSAGAILRFGQHASVLPTTAQEVEVSGTLSGPGSITAQGAAGSLFTLSYPEYSGDTSVNSGKLSLGADNPNNNSSSINIASAGATLDLQFSGTDTVQKLFIGGVQQPAGIYKAADNTTDPGTAIPQISGTGTLTVSSSPAPVSGFSSWASSNGIPNALPGGDADADGLSNLTEYALGTSPTAATPSPAVLSGNTLTFTKGAEAIANGDVIYSIETSNDLGTTDPWAAVVTHNPPNSATTISHTFNPATAPRKFARLRIVLTP